MREVRRASLIYIFLECLWLHLLFSPKPTMHTRLVCADRMNPLEIVGVVEDVERRLTILTLGVVLDINPLI